MCSRSSFNSSGATVVPDRETRDRPNNVSSLSSARVLMPQDTLGRELDAALGGDGIGNFDMVHAVGTEILRPWSLLHHADTLQLQSHAQMPSRQPSFSADFAVLLANPSPSTSDILASFQIDTTANTLPTSNPTPNPSSHRPIPEEQALSPEIFRPSSAHSYRSHRSSVSGSDYSYTTTEVDSDEAERMTSPGNNLPWEVGQYPTPGPSAGDPSPPTVPGSVTGPMRGPSNDEEAARKRRLERKPISIFVPSFHSLTQSLLLILCRPPLDQSQICPKASSTTS